MRFPVTAAALLASLALSSTAYAQPAAPPAPSPPPVAPYGPTITAEQAQAAMTAAEAHARQNGWVVAITIVENSGDLVMFKKATGTQYGSTQVAMNKARSAAMFRRPSKAFADQAASGSIVPLAVPGAMPIEGGVPIIVGGRQIGAIGVSGVQAQQDGQIAAAGAAAVR